MQRQAQRAAVCAPTSCIVPCPRPPTHPPLHRAASLPLQALGERIRPVMTVNKIDRCFLELMMDPEDAFLSFRRCAPLGPLECWRCAPPRCAALR